jgi:hypothetical protein
MSQSKNPASNQPTDNTNQRVRCVGGCGFWGDATTKNFCSVCFAKNCPDEAAALKNKKAAPPSNQENDSSPNDSNDPESKEDPAVAVVANEEEDKKPAKKVQKKKNRCWICRKKMSLAGQFACGCGYTFCAKHRYPDSHDCDIDHKKKHQEHLAKANQVVAFKKVEEI